MNRVQEVLIYITAYHQEQNAEGRKGGFNYWSDLDDIGVLKNHVEEFMNGKRGFAIAAGPVCIHY